MKKNICLEFNNGKSHKVYNVDLVNESDGLFVVNFSYGRYGSTLRTGTKTQFPVSYDKAQTVFDKLVKAKSSKGYFSASGENTHMHVESKSTGVSCQLLNTTTEGQVVSFMTGKTTCWWMQEKHDGERKLVRITNGEVLVINKLGNATSISSSIIDELILIDEDILIDGEDLGDAYIVFDLLEYKGVDMRHMPYKERLERLERIGFYEIVEIIKTARTESEKLDMMQGLKKNSAEGVVFKNPKSQFEAGRPNSGGNQLKFKFYDTASVIVSHVNEKRSVGMSIIDDKGNLIVIGNVAIPVNKNIPLKGVVIEVRYLYAYPRGSLYQPTFLKVRNDVLPSECVIGQLKYKRGLRS